VLPAGEPASEGFYSWKQFVKGGGLDGPGKIGKMLGRAARGPSCGPSKALSPQEEAAYEAPFPDTTYKAGARAFPELVPTPESDPTGRPQGAGIEVNRAMWRVFEGWTKPVLLAFSDGDPVLGGLGDVWREKCPGCKGQRHVTLSGGVGHFSQDGGGDQLVQVLIRFVEETPLAGRGTSKL